MAGVAQFLFRLEPELLALQRELVAGAWRPGTPGTFQIHDPKTRTITAAPFRDRVVHHALMDRLEPAFDRRMIHESFACRKGKGTHRARDHARALLRRHGWFLKLDIQKCFPTIRHSVVRETVARVIKDPRVLDLCDVILRGPEGNNAEIGLPIGNLTSQWFANLVLDRLDHFVKEDLRVPGYVRYLDDFVLFAGTKSVLNQAHAAVADWLTDVLHLTLKHRITTLAPAHAGLPFLGFRLYRGGSFNNRAVNARSAYRNRNTPGNRNNNLGLRPASVFFSSEPDRVGRPQRRGPSRSATRRPRSASCARPFEQGAGPKRTASPGVVGQTARSSRQRPSCRAAPQDRHVSRPQRSGAAPPLPLAGSN